MDTIWVVGGVIVQIWRGAARSSVVAPMTALLFEVEPDRTVCGQVWPPAEEA